MKKNKNRSFAYYYAKATNYIFTLISPVVLMLLIYYFFSKKVFHKENYLILIIMVLLGLVSGYWALFKEINMDNKK